MCSTPLVWRTVFWAWAMLSPLVERVQNQYDEKEAAALEKKPGRNELDLNDFLNQIKQIKKMGNLKDLMSMIPVGKALRT